MIRTKTNVHNKNYARSLAFVMRFICSITHTNLFHILTQVWIYFEKHCNLHFVGRSCVENGFYWVLIDMIMNLKTSIMENRKGKMSN